MVNGENSDALSTLLPLFMSVYCLLQTECLSLAVIYMFHSSYVVEKALDIIEFNTIHFHFQSLVHLAGAENICDEGNWVEEKSERLAVAVIY